MTAYYNEWEPYPAQWLRNLIAANLIAKGDVDERSIKDVKADDLRGYTQCHFFAGIGGWSYALRLAGWPDERPVWTGSCPCQPFSGAGRQAGHSDGRHLWPYWRRLIEQSGPPKIFGEQVAGAITFGWWDEVAADLEAQNYACAAAVLPACSIGASHQRDRLFFVADAECSWVSVGRGAKTVGSEGKKLSGISRDVRPGMSEQEKCLFPNPNRERQQKQRLAQPACSEHAGLKLHSGWEAEPEVGRVVNGFYGRTQQLRAYGNAIVPQVAQAFIEAFMECRP